MQMTLNTYSHLYPNKQSEVAAQLESIINGTTVPNNIQFVAIEKKKSPESLVIQGFLGIWILFKFDNY